MVAKNFNIRVTQEDNEAGKRGESGGCAVVRALARQIPRACRFEVDSQSIRFTLDGVRLRYFTPLTVQHYIAAFDAGEDIPPFSFRLRDGHVVKQYPMSEPTRQARRALQRAYADTMHQAKARGDGITDEDRLAARRAGSAAYDAVKAQYGTEESKQGQGLVGTPPAPRIVKTRRRTYGHRMLRTTEGASL